MKVYYQNCVNQMIENFEKLKKAFMWESDNAKHLIALNYAMNQKSLNVDDLSEMKQYIKSSTGAFSPFRGIILFPMSGMVITASDQPKEMVNRMIANLDVLKRAGFKSSTYLPTALYALETANEGLEIKSLIDKAFSIYKEMKSNHPFLTGGDDYALAILLASSNHNPDLLEQYYSGLVEVGFAKCNGLQMMSHILSFGGSSVYQGVDKCKFIYDRLKAAKLKVSYDYYPAIALMSLLNDHGELIDDMIEIATYLLKQKSYKWLGKGMNILMASAIVSSHYVSQDGDILTTSLTVSIQSIIAAQQAAMIAATSTAVVATSGT